MSKLRMRISVSLDGFVAGPDQTFDEPLGQGGEALHEWVFPLASWREPHGLDGGEVNVSSEVLDETQRNIGATIMGRKMFGGGPGPWATGDAAWTGWWGNEPPFHHPVFVLTHHDREPLELEGTTFTFVSDGIEAALTRARTAAAGADVALVGGAETCNQYLAAGLVDEMVLHHVPILLAGGERLFDGVGPDLRGLELDRAVPAPGVTHLIFVRGSADSSS